MIFKTGIEWKLLQVKGKLDVMNMVNATQNVPTEENHIRTLNFCVNLKYETQNSKCGTEPKKGENSKTRVGRISTYGVVPAKTGNSSISCSFKNSCCMQECVKTTEDKTQNVF